MTCKVENAGKADGVNNMEVGGVGSDAAVAYGEEASKKGKTRTPILFMQKERVSLGPDLGLIHMSVHCCKLQCLLSSWSSEQQKQKEADQTLLLDCLHASGPAHRFSTLSFLYRDLNGCHNLLQTSKNANRGRPIKIKIIIINWTMVFPSFYFFIFPFTVNLLYF